MTYDGICILIPAYKPDKRLIKLVSSLRAEGFARVVVVDDGSGAGYADIFTALKGSAEVLEHESNRGKGAALKTGFTHLMGDDAVLSVITVDADGQHTPEDCVKIAKTISGSPGAIVLGVRDKRKMPPRSRAGNTITCYTLGFVTGLWLTDTQTGLRGLPAAALERMASLKGDRYEYELNMLIDAHNHRMEIILVNIETIYIDNNRGSHFDTIRDSARVYSLLLRQIVAYVGSSSVSALVEYAVFLLLSAFFTSLELLIIPVAGARAVSSLVNYTINHNMVFRRSGARRSAYLYGALVVLMMLLSWSGIALLTHLGMKVWLAKPLIDGILFFFNYHAQRNVVFRDWNDKSI
jgi:glycosyltransferase involved in cell wall biosynthesis